MCRVMVTYKRRIWTCSVVAHTVDDIEVIVGVWSSRWNKKFSMAISKIDAKEFSNEFLTTLRARARAQHEECECKDSPSEGREVVRRRKGEMRGRISDDASFFFRYRCGFPSPCRSRFVSKRATIACRAAPREENLVLFNPMASADWEKLRFSHR